MSNINTVSIKFKPGAYGVFRNLQNKVWYALGEYVDNAVQSFENNKSRLQKTNNGKYQFEVRINVDWESDFIRIYDNAAGIDSKNFLRAFEPANIPIDNTGLHEFGMGMKTASIWLADLWSVKTAPLDENEERFVEFDLKKVLKDEQEILTVKNTTKSKNKHFTELVLHRLSKNAPNAYQMDKVKRHLSSIYRKYLRNGEMKLFINDEEQSYNDPEILVAPYYTKPDGKKVTWIKKINYNYGDYKAIGFVALLNELSTNEHNGFSLFRRGRVIEGSHDEKYRPKALSGQVGSFRYKRIFGELELVGFDVSFNKGSFQEQGDIEALIDGLKIELSSDELNLLKQADEYRKPKAKEDNAKVAKNIVNTLKKETKTETLKSKVDTSIKEIENKINSSQNEKLIKKAKTIESHEEIIDIKGEKFKLKVEMINEPSITDLYTVSIEDDELFSKKATYKINLSHPFFARFDQFEKDDDYLPIILIIRALVLAEIFAPSQGTKKGGNVRINFNTFLKNI
jgi:hypothetical protein